MILKMRLCLFKGLGGCFVRTLQMILIKVTSIVDEAQIQFEYISVQFSRKVRCLVQISGNYGT